jgi:hypothetical protein
MVADMEWVHTVDTLRNCVVMQRHITSKNGQNVFDLLG